jgi:hypothetical protein
MITTVFIYGHFIIFHVNLLVIYGIILTFFVISLRDYVENCLWQLCFLLPHCLFIERSFDVNCCCAVNRPRFRLNCVIYATIKSDLRTGEDECLWSNDVDTAIRCIDTSSGGRARDNGGKSSRFIGFCFTFQLRKRATSGELSR